jgi:hypothetical protein
MTLRYLSTVLAPADEARDVPERAHVSASVTCAIQPAF